MKQSGERSLLHLTSEEGSAMFLRLLRSIYKPSWSTTHHQARGTQNSSPFKHKVCAFSVVFSRSDCGPRASYIEIKLPAQEEFSGCCPLSMPSSKTCWPNCLFFEAVVFFRKGVSL